MATTEPYTQPGESSQHNTALQAIFILHYMGDTHIHGNLCLSPKQCLSFKDPNLCMDFLSLPCMLNVQPISLKDYPMFGKKYILWSSSLCNFLYLPIIFFLLGSNIFLSILISNTLHLFFLSFWWETKLHNHTMITKIIYNIHGNMKF